MDRSLSVSDLAHMLREACTAAAGLQHRLALPPHEREDLAQDLLLDLLCRLPAFDPERGTLGAFAATVLGNCTCRITARVKREWRLQGGALVSLDAPLAEGFSLADTLREDEGVAAWLGQPTAGAASEIRMTVASALDRLEEPDRALCRALGQASVDRLAACGVGSRAGLYRRLRELRLQLTAFGLQAA